MENKKRVQPNDYDNVDDFIRASFSRKGSKNKYNPTLHLKEIYRKSGCKDIVDYDTFTSIFKEVCKNIRKMLVKGHAVKFPYFGTLQATEYNYKSSNIDRRPIDFRRMLESQFGVENGEPIRGEVLPSITFYFYDKKYKRLRSALFLPMKYMVREFRNIKHGTNYYIYPYDD
jgi:hypothetical protein